MIDWFVLLTPLAVLLILFLFRFVGCDRVWGLSHFPPADLSLTWEGRILDRVGQDTLALTPDGADDGTLTVTLGLSGGRTVIALQLNSYPHGSTTPAGTWDTDGSTVHFALGASLAFDGPLLNDPGNAGVNFFVPEGSSFAIFASDFQDMEFLSGNTLSLVAAFSDLSTASATVVIP